MKSILKTIIIFATLILSSAASAAVAESGKYDLDLSHSNVGFRVSHMGISIVVGRFNKFAGEIVFNPSGDSSVDVTIETASVDTNSQRRDDHLRGADFFSVTKFPTMKYVSTLVKYDPEGNPTEVEGNLTLHGVTKAVTLQVETTGAGKIRGASHAGFHAEAVIQRADFGMDKLIGAAGNEVTIVIDVEAAEKN